MQVGDAQAEMSVALGVARVYGNANAGSASHEGWESRSQAYYSDQQTE